MSWRSGRWLGSGPRYSSWFRAPNEELLIRISESFETIPNFVKPIKIGGGVDHIAAAVTENRKGAIR